MDDEDRMLREIRRQGTMTRWTVVLSILAAAVGFGVFLLNPQALLGMSVELVLVLVLAGSVALLARSAVGIRERRKSRSADDA